MNLYPPIEAYNNGRLRVSNLHELYFEEAGNPHGDPVVFLHGGPGGGINADCRRFFDPQHYRIVLFDQRGSGRSTPYAEIRENTTWDLIEDVEKLRKYLGIGPWHVFGGSWGSTLALTYAITHPHSVKSLALRGIFMCTPREIHWFYQDGASHIYPDAWEKYIEPIPREEQTDLIPAFYKRLTGDNKELQIAAARAWSVWEASTCKLHPDEKIINEFNDAEFAIAFARIECHFFINKVFFDEPDFILKNVNKIRHIPCEIVHGRYDVVCPVENAWTLHKTWPEAQLHIINDAGHSAMEPGIIKTLIEMTDRFKNL